MGRYVFLKNAPSPWGSGPPFSTWYLGPPESSSQTASRSVQPFLYGSQSQMLCCTMRCQRGRKHLKLPLPLGISDFATPPEEDRATAIGNMYKNGNDRACGSGDILADRQSHTHTGVLITYFATAPSGKVYNKWSMG